MKAIQCQHQHTAHPPELMLEKHSLPIETVLKIIEISEVQHDLFKTSEYLTEAYQIYRLDAKEGLVAVVSDLNRKLRQDCPHATAIA